MQYLQRHSILGDNTEPRLDIFTNPPLPSGSFTDLLSTNLMQFYRIKAERR